MQGNSTQPTGKSDSRIIRLPEVLKKTGLSRSSIYFYIKKGSFPGPIPLGERAVGWIENEVDTWVSLRIEDRNSNQEVSG
jgi:prophage regulatory protein